MATTQARSNRNVSGKNIKAKGIQAKGAVAGRRPSPLTLNGVTFTPDYDEKIVEVSGRFSDDLTPSMLMRLNTWTAKVYSFMGGRRAIAH